MNNLVQKRVLGAALATTLTLILLATVFGKDSRFDVLISAVGALGQIWIAGMLYVLAKAQFAHQQRTDQANHAMYLYPNRVELQKEFREAKREIGTTAVNPDHVNALAPLGPRIAQLFGREIGEGAKSCTTLARKALERARSLNDERAKMTQDEELRSIIKAFREAEETVYRGMTEKIRIEI